MLPTECGPSVLPYDDAQRHPLLVLRDFPLSLGLLALVELLA